MNRSIDLNADLGEGMPWDFELLARVTSANVSCGAHAGDPNGIVSTLLEAQRWGVIVGAHPSWPDSEGFGRVERSASAEEVETLVLGQVAYLRSLADPLGLAIRYVKPHGALYNQAMRDDPASAAIGAGLVAAVAKLGLPLMGQPGTVVKRMVADATLPYVTEGFPDRNYRDDGRLVPRSQPGAMVEGVDAVVAQALRLVDRGLDSLCLHGDAPEAVARADAIRAALDRAGVVVRSFL
jgi:5-oxoprolinase (ATP-hydrolysing) subunit A